MKNTLPALPRGFEGAKTLALAGVLALGLAPVAAAAPRQGSLVEPARRQAEQLARAQKPEQAWAVLERVRLQARPGDTAYWQLYGDQAWARGARAQALPAYQRVWQAGAANARVLERLIEHHNDSGEPERAIAVGQQAYEKLAEARWLLLAMDAASRASQWDALRTLARQAQDAPDKFSDSEMYWLLEAHIASHDGHKPRARAAYRQALALNPASVPTRAQLLWFEIDGGDPQQLAAHLKAWQADAQRQPAYWSAYAVGLLQLGQVPASLAWYERQVSEQPDDYLWQLSYVSALSQAGPPEAQERMRRDLAHRLKDRLALLDALPKSDARVVWLAYAAMVRDFEGAAAADQVLQQALARGHSDAQVYELLVASSLAQKNVPAAHGWLLRAQAQQQRLPAYQVLAVALAQNDPQAIDQLLQARAQELSAADRVTALRQLGRNVLALSLTEKSLFDGQDASSELLRQHRDQLKVQLARRIEVGYETRNLSDLNIRRSHAALSLPQGAGRTTLRLAHHSLRPDGDRLALAGAHSENDLSLLAELSVRGDPVRLTLGRNQRADKSLNQARLEWTHALGPRLSTRLEASFNGLTEETSALRAIGSKDKVSLGLSGPLTEQTYARLELARQYFHTRQRDALGQGYRAEGELGTTISSRYPGWQARISASAERNRLAAELPPGLAGSVLPAGQTLDGVLSPRFSTLGVGSTLRFGPLDGGGRRAHGLVDGWVGRQWPASERAYSLRAALSVPVLADGEFRLEAFHTNVQGGVSSQTNRGVAAWYRHAF